MRGVSFGNIETPQTHYAPDTLSNMTSVAVETYSNKVFTYTDNNGVTASYNANGITFGGATDTLKLFYGYNRNTEGILYYWKHKKNGELVEDLIPCVHNSKGAMYDQIENKMYYNANASASTGFRAFIEYDGVAYEVGDNIESTGTQWIETDYSPDANTRVTLKAELDSSATPTNVVVGTRVSDDNYGRFFPLAYGTASGRYRVTFGTSDTSYALPSDGMLEIDYDAKTQKAIVNGAEISIEGSFIKTAENNMGLFGTTGYSDNHYIGKGKLFYTKFYDNGELVRDFIPVKKSDGTIGMLDLVTRTLYTNSGSGAFSFNALSP